MSPITFTHVKSGRRVIVRAWHDAPVVLLFDHADSKDTYVCSKPHGKTIALPHGEVFAFDQVRLEALEGAFSTNKASLGELYEGFHKDDFACNKYQDNLESMHDQEDITDSERIAGGDDQ